MTAFAVTQLVVRVAGDQQSSIDAHVRTVPARTRKRGTDLVEVLSVAIGSLLIHCHGPECVRALATRWESTLDQARKTVPALLDQGSTRKLAEDTQIGAVIDIVADLGAVHAQAIPAGASRDGRAHVLVRTGPLVVQAYDLAAVTAWAEAWTTAAQAASRIWPSTPTSGPEYRERLERDAAARTGTYRTWAEHCRR